MRGVLIRHPFGIQVELIRAMAYQDTVYILVNNANAQNQATNTLTAGNVSMGHIKFITASTNSHWTRDWGPQFVFVNDTSPAIADPIFDGYPWVPGFRYPSPYDDDDAVNAILAQFFGYQHLPLGVYLTGGNFMCDGFSQAFSTAQMLSENMGTVSSDQFLDVLENQMGIDDYVFTINPEYYGIQHIDCWAKLLDEETVLVKELPASHPEYDRAEQIAALFTTQNNHFGQPYRVIRIFCGLYSGNNAAAYTNSLILNKRVYVPIFGIDSDAIALQTYREAMPGYEVLGFSGSWYHYDALHCRTMGIADREMLRIVHQPFPANTVIPSSPLSLNAKIKSYGNHVFLTGYPKLWYKFGNSDTWQSQELLSTTDPDVYHAEVDIANQDTEFEYYFQVIDSSGREMFKPLMAPAKTYSVMLSATSAIHDLADLNSGFKLYPNPTANSLNIKLNQEAKQDLELCLYNLKGQLLIKQKLPPGSAIKTISTENLPTGVYLLRLSGTKSSLRRKICIVK